MSLALSSSRSHFFKHLGFYNRAFNLFSLRRRIHRQTPPSGFFISPPVEAGRLSRLFSAVANCSAPPFNNGANYTSPYLSVHICCPKNLSDALSESLMCFGANSTTIDEQDGRIHRQTPPSGFFISPPVEAGRLSRLFSAVANCSAPPFNNGANYTSPYLSVHICCPKNLSDALSESLMCFGANSTTIDEQDGRGSDEEIWIGSTFDVDQDVEECISRAANSVGLKEIPNYKVRKQDHIDWIKKTQESFHPVEITEGLWIVPEWRNPPDIIGSTNIILNPGLAFGTGEHPTTKACLLLLRRLIKGGECFLDYGTGSGVLAIAALKFGADISVGFDIEAQAITSARYNAALNNIGPEKLQLSLVPSKIGAQFESQPSIYNSKIIAEKGKYDVVIANILLHPLLDLADLIVSYGKPRATIAVSGIISEQVPIVMERYSQLLEDVNITMVDDWACISGSKIA